MLLLGRKITGQQARTRAVSLLDAMCSSNGVCLHAAAHHAHALQLKE